MIAGHMFLFTCFAWSYLLVWQRFPVGGPVARPLDLILIRVLHPGLFPDRTWHLRE
jgi:hypothetical protein